MNVHYFKELWKSSLMILMLCFGLTSVWGQVSENFQTGLPTSYGSGNYTLSSGTWNGTQIVRETRVSGNYCVQLRSQTGAQITTPNITSGVGIVSFLAYRTSGSGSSLQVRYSTDGGSNWVQAPESPYTLNATWNSYTATIESSDSNILVQFYRTDGTVRIDDVEITSYSIPTPCDPETLTAGTAVSNVAEVASGGSVNLSLDGASTGSGLSYQWQSSADGNNWSDIDGATSATYNATNITTDTYFRATVGCEETTVNSVNVQVTLTYCTPTYSSGGANDKITNVTLGDLNNSATGATTAPYYTFYDSVTIPDITTGETIEVSVSFGSDGTQHSAIWIDFNQNKIFEPSEGFLGTNPGQNGTYIYEIPVPLDAVLGNTRMRIRGGDDSALTTSQACGASNSNWGETEDYIVNIVAGCIPSTYSFANATLNKTTEDVAFINAFTSDNNSATVFASSNTGVATVNPTTGEVTLVGVGTTTISVTQEADGTYCAVTASYELTVISALPVLEFSGNQDMGAVCFQSGDTLSITYTLTNSGGSAAENVNIGISNPMGFLISTPVTNQTIESGASIDFTVTFNSSMGGTPGINNATLTVNSSAPSPTTYPISAMVNTTIPGGVTTSTAIVNGNDVTFNGNITSLGTCWNTTEKGFVYATTPNPEVGGYHQSAGGTPIFSGPYNYSLNGFLTPGITYYYKAYVKYTENFVDNYVYGEEQSFIIPLATPTATAATDITPNSFTANWNAVNGATSYEVDVYTVEGSAPVPVTVVGWNFEDENATADSGIESNNEQAISTNATGLTYSNMSGSDGYVATTSGGWNGGSGSKYWQVSFTTTNISTLKLSSVQRSSNTGPRDFKVQYSLNNTDWTDVSGAIVTVANDYTTGVLTNISLPVECENQPLVYLRWIMTSNTSANNGTVAGAGTSAIDNIIINGEQGGTTNVPVTGSPFTSNEISQSVTGLDPETTYKYVVKAKTAAVTTGNSNEISVTTLAAPIITWTTENVWSNVDGPTLTDDAIIEGNLTLLENLSAKTLTVASGGKITVPANMVLTVDEAIFNEAGAANFVVENDGILIQNTDTENTGAITVERNSNPMRRLEYTLWSSPVTGQNLQAFSPATLPNRIYELKETESVLGWTSVADPSATNFEPGKGYFFRSPNNYDPVNQQVFEGQFIGTPNNGDVNIMASYEFNGIGNPYPSPIDADEFILANDINALYFWTNNNAPVEGSYNTVNNWATYVVGSGTTAQGGGLMPDGIIQSGQGFIVGFVPGDQGNINFNNAMRVAENGQFFKPMSSEKHRIWLNLSNEEVVFNQILVGYIENATQGVDTGMDAKMFGYDGNALYSIIDNSNENYVIQARKLPFTASDVVALGFRAVNAGSFTISLNNVDGLFADNQNIYLKDNFTQAVHNLKDGAYTFVSEEGIFDTRFEVVYQTTMSTENPVANNANWVVYSQENGFQIQTQGFELKSVQVFDLLGRAIYTANAEGTAHSIPSLGADSVYIVKVTTTENIVLSKKVR